MLFNSVNYAIFLPIVFIIYWFLSNNNLNLQNKLLLVASYFFYASWDWRFLFLLIFSTLLDFYTGIKINQTLIHSKKKTWFLLSIFINIGFLGVFKYYNFFITSFTELLLKLDLHIDIWTLNLILPIGISFYTFHGLSYIIDIFKDRIKPERNLFDYALFVSFFPLLVAGPIERATHLLPQIKQKRIFNYLNAVDGLKQIIWGLFKKIVIADQCAVYSNMIFNSSNDYIGSTLFLGAFFFSFQIYCDFSGYSDIALGTSRLFGFELLRNFAFPYFSRDIAEFWRRWHISLSSWFRDYIYIPLGGSKVNIFLKIRNIIIIFVISGFWHGANLTFIVWGLINAFLILPSILSNQNRNNLEIVAKGRTLPSIKEVLSIIITFTLITLSWIFFRAENLTHAISIISEIFSPSLFIIQHSPSAKAYIPTIILIIFFVIIEWFGREDEYAIAKIGLKWRVGFRWLIYYAIILSIFYSTNKSQQFIYFQF